jgi:hypothetical protein
MKIDIVFLVILGFMVLRTICNNKADVKEHMAVSDEIKNEIKAIYNADVTAIQNLSDIANKLQAAGGLTIPGPLNITGATSVGGALNVGGALGVTGNINGATITGSTLATGGSIWCSGTIFAGAKQDINIVDRLLAAEAKIQTAADRLLRLEAATQHMDTSATETTFKTSVKLKSGASLYINDGRLFFRSGLISFFSHEDRPMWQYDDLVWGNNWWLQQSDVMNFRKP